MCEGIMTGTSSHMQSPVVPLGREATATAAGASTAERHETSIDIKKLHSSENAPCFPSCMEMDTLKQVRVVVEAMTTCSSGDNGTPVPTGRRSRRNSRRVSIDDNQTDRATGPSLDLEDAAAGVLSPLDTRSQPPLSSSIVVDYDEGMPERSRTDLLLRAEPVAADCAPEACKPLDAVALDTLAIEDMSTSSRIPLRPRVNSTSQPSSRKGKSVVLSTSIAPEVERPLAAVSYPASRTTESKDEEKEEPVERCSSFHKLCLCEVRLHNTRESCWLVASGSVYDVTGLVDVHPGGARSILRKAGGPDCTKDMKFHSKAARKMMDKCFIGKLVPCGDEPQADEPAACTIM